MPKYFFETFDGENDSKDDRGIDCESRDEVSYHAVMALIDMMRDELPNGPTREFKVIVRDQAAAAVFEASVVLESGWTD